MSNSPAPPPEAVRQWVDAKSYDRGKEIAKGAFVSGGRLYAVPGGVRAAGRLAGTTTPFYRVGATVADGQVTAAACTCPVGLGESVHGGAGHGRCKHVAALLLIWRRDPGRFASGENPRAALARLSKAELAERVLELLNRAAEAEDETAWDLEAWDELNPDADWGLAPDPAPPAP